MTIRVPNGGELLMLGRIVNKIPQEDLVLCLYSNNITPSETDTISTYTELTGTYGYAAKTLTGANWTTTSGDPCSADYAQQTWTFTGAQGNVYGYFVRGASTAALIYAERFSDGPYNVTTNGDMIKVTPKLTLQDTVDV